MSYNRNDSDKNLSYMDGIPVKISEQYKPPKKITLPVGVINRHGNENFEEYDFRLEKSMARKMVEWRELRKANAERRRQRLEMEEKRTGTSGTNETASTSEAMSRLRVQSPEPASASQPSQPHLRPSLVHHHHQEKKSPPAASSYTLPSARSNEPILTPVPVDKPSASYTSNRSIDPSKNTFNISDFESDTSSPFDNMELKTLNDYEELAHVLQPNFASPNSNSASNVAAKNAHTDMNTIRSHCSVSGKGPQTSQLDMKSSDMPYPPRINGMALYNAYNNSSGLWQQQQNHHHQQYTASAHSNVHTSNYNIGGRTWVQPMLSNYNNPNVQSYVVQRVESVDQSTGPSSKSVPDIIQELELELRDKRDADVRRNARILDQPARPASVGPAEDELAKQKGLNSLPQSVLPNPLGQLTPSCQQLSARIAEMGFPVARVARAVQRFGDNETRVLEFLLQIQNFEEKGCPADRAEQALVANKYNETETLRYLEALKQLLDLGFVELKVTEALAQHSNDRDKALDSLIS